MERIAELYDGVKDVEEYHRQMEDKALEIAKLQSEVERLVHELEMLRNHRISDEIEVAEEEYEACLREIDRMTLHTAECHNMDELRRAFSRIPEPEVLLTKSTSLLRTLFYPSCVARESAQEALGAYGYGSSEVVVLKINREAEELLEFLMKHPEIFRKSYDVLKAELSEEMDGVIPVEVQTYEDEMAIYLVFQSKKERDALNEIQLRELRKVGRLSSHKMISHIVADVLKDNLRSELIRRELSDEDVEKNNERLDGTDLFIANTKEWRLDVIMKAIIDQTRKPKDVTVQESATRADNLPPKLSVDYLEFLRALNLFKGVQSKRMEKARRVVERAAAKAFDKRRCEASVHNYFVQFADISHLLRTCPEYSSMEELVRAKEDLFHLIVRGSSRIRIGLDEPLMMLKLYLKEQHFDFMENVTSFVPKVNQILFEAQFFELLIEEFCSKLLGLRRLSKGLRTSLGLAAGYMLDLSFHLPSGALKGKERLLEIRMLLESNVNEILDSYRSGKLHMEWNELMKFCAVILGDPKDVDYLARQAVG
jgi:hypothetical protein